MKKSKICITNHKKVLRELIQERDDLQHKKKKWVKMWKFHPNVNVSSGAMERRLSVYIEVKDEEFVAQSHLFPIRAKPTSPVAAYRDLKLNKEG